MEAIKKKPYKLVFKLLAFSIFVFNGEISDFIIHNFDPIFFYKDKVLDRIDTFPRVHWINSVVPYLITSCIISYYERNEKWYIRLTSAIIISYLSDQYISSMFLNASSRNWSDIIILVVTLAVFFIEDFKTKVKNYVNKQ